MTAERHYTGQRAGHYKLGKEIGRGSNGVVYHASHVQDLREAAVKVLLTVSPQKDVRFLREAIVQARVEHQGLVKVFDYGYLADQTPYYAMELLRGSDLARHLRDKNGQRRLLQTAEAVRIAHQIALVVAAVHEEKVVHRDLKPANIFLLESPRPQGIKLLDFGVAKVLNGATLLESAQVTHTTEGQWIGTPLYMAPEQIAGTEVDGRADVFALGVILYEMLCGRPPLEAVNANQLMLKRMMADVSVEWVVAVPKGLRRFVERMMAKDPEQRPSMAAVAHKLQSAAEERRSRWPIWAMAGLAVGGVALAESLGVTTQSIKVRDAPLVVLEDLAAVSARDMAAPGLDAATPAPRDLVILRDSTAEPTRQKGKKTKPYEPYVPEPTD